jgi:hypothetical protein
MFGKVGRSIHPKLPVYFRRPRRAPLGAEGHGKSDTNAFRQTNGHFVFTADFIGLWHDAGAHCSIYPLGLTPQQNPLANELICDSINQAIRPSYALDKRPIGLLVTKIEQRAIDIFQYMY